MCFASGVTPNTAVWCNLKEYWLKQIVCQNEIWKLSGRTEIRKNLAVFETGGCIYFTLRVVRFFP